MERRLISRCDGVATSSSPLQCLSRGGLATGLPRTPGSWLHRLRRGAHWEDRFTVLGNVIAQVTTNAASGNITRKFQLAVAQDLKCLVGPDPTLGTVPVALEDRRLLSDTSPSDASWIVPTAPLLILDQVESAGTPVRASGPLAGRSAVVLGIGNATGDHWWIEVAANGDNRFVGHSHTNQGPLVVGQPSMNSQWAGAAIDLDGDHRMDFSYQAIAPGTVNAQHWLHPFSNHRILVPLLAGMVWHPQPKRLERPDQR